MNWTQTKPTEVGSYLMHNPGIRHSTRIQEVILSPNKGLTTVHPPNDEARTVKIKDMPNAFWWLGPLPDLPFETPIRGQSDDMMAGLNRGYNRKEANERIKARRNFKQETQPKE